MAERKEAANDIKVVIGDGKTVVVETLSLNEEFDVETVYGSGRQFPSGYAIKQAKFQGSFTCKGNQTTLKKKFFDSSGMPKVMDAITVNHMEVEMGDGSTYQETTDYEEVICTNKGYEMNDGEIVETKFEFIAMNVDDVDYDTE